MSLYLTFKSLHLIAVISWMAGLLYLPRIFVYHVENSKKKIILLHNETGHDTYMDIWYFINLFKWDRSFLSILDAAKNSIGNFFVDLS